MRRSKKSEYRRGVLDGMLDSFFNVTYLSISENVEARKLIVIKSSSLSVKTWKEERTNSMYTLEDAYWRGYSAGRNGWENDEEMNEVSRMATLEVRLAKYIMTKTK